MIKKILILIISLISLETQNAEIKINAEKKYLEISSDNLQLLRDIIANTGLNVKTLHPLIFDYLSSFRLITSFKSYLALMSVLQNGKFLMYDGYNLVTLNTLSSNEKELIHDNVSCSCGICILPNNKIAFVTCNRKIEIFDVETCTSLKILDGHKFPIRSLCALPGNKLASESYDETIKIWDLNTGECLKRINCFMNPNIASNTLCLLQNGTLACCGSSKIQIYDINSGKCLQTVVDSDSVKSLCALPNNRFAAGFENKTIKIWNTDSLEDLQTLEGHEASVDILRLLSNKYLISSDYQVIKIWDIDSLKCVQTINKVGFHFDIHPLSNGSFIIAGPVAPKMMDNFHSLDTNKIEIWAPTLDILLKNDFKNN